MKRFIFLLLLILSCSHKTTNIFIQKPKPKKGLRCVVPPLRENKMKAPPFLPDTSYAAAGAGMVLLKRQMIANAPQTVIDFKVLVLLVDFADSAHQFKQNPAYFDQLFFADTGKTFKTYYKEQSYGKINALPAYLPSAVGILRLPQTYSYYANGNYGTGGYPQNAQRMAMDAVLAADGQVDFSQYDNDGNGEVDGIVIIHAGTGGELTGDPNDIWSHAWNFPAVTVDGKIVKNYCTTPEYWTQTREMQIGVIVHEGGHLYFNQIDEYGTSGLWQGLGRHCGMAGGSYNGTTGLGDDPAPFCAASKVRAGFNVPIPIDTAGYYSIPMGVVLRYGTGSEIFYVEQAQRVGSNQPGSGLRIIHGKSTVAGMYYRWYPPLNADVDGWGLYQIVQADGLFELEKNLSSGDAEDYWPGTLGKTILDSTTSPTSNYYSGTTGIPSGFNLSQITANSFIFGRFIPPPPPPDTIPCPNDTTIFLRGKGQKGKAIFYIGPPDCSPPTGTFFPIGVHTVNCTNCQFTVTVKRIEKWSAPSQKMLGK